ncbi:unnamed protein product [Dibothriocephalus latus]|uniref:Uncharacterized protein n=1 Tax=Dibothriocephalus latus TaxID=60516 RepID=A0A3P7MHU9_DIBLA|nr:unnamed protein product [Dibothriocephalus latus]
MSGLPRSQPSQISNLNLGWTWHSMSSSPLANMSMHRKFSALYPNPLVCMIWPTSWRYCDLHATSWSP